MKSLLNWLCISFFSLGFWFAWLIESLFKSDNGLVVAAFCVSIGIFIWGSFTIRRIILRTVREE